MNLVNKKTDDDLDAINRTRSRSSSLTSLSSSSSTNLPEIKPLTRAFKISKHLQPQPPPSNDIKPLIISSSSQPHLLHPPITRKPKIQSNPLKRCPFPKFLNPTHLDCQSVLKILIQIHGQSPKRDHDQISSTAIKPLAQSCGEVIDPLDALIRTILSQHTTTLNSERAYQSLIHRIGSSNYGLILEIGFKELTNVIRIGGLAQRKAKVIINLLNQLQSRNQAQEISLDELKIMSDEEVITTLISFDGVGLKTAACVMMFCLGRDIFPVDTHIFRLAHQLGWIPSRANRDQAFYHLNQLIPNSLKYSLHLLLIQHGQSCHLCSNSSTTKKSLKTQNCLLKSFIINRHSSSNSE